MTEGSISIGGMNIGEEIKTLKNKIAELESKICDHEWIQETIQIVMAEQPIEIDGKKIVQRQIATFRICGKCAMVGLMPPEEVQKMMQTESGIYLPGGDNGRP